MYIFNNTLAKFQPQIVKIVWVHFYFPPILNYNKRIKKKGDYYETRETKKNCCCK